MCNSGSKLGGRGETGEEPLGSSSTRIDQREERKKIKGCGYENNNKRESEFFYFGEDCD